MIEKARKVRVFLVDDHSLIRHGVRALLEREGQFPIVGEAGSGRDAVAQVLECPMDVVLMDIGMPGLDGIEATRAIREKSPATRVVVLSMRSGEDYVRRAREAGASGYCTKDCSHAELLAALHTVSRGDSYETPPAAGITKLQRDTTGFRPQLTPRQAQVIELIALSHTSKEIARRLSISVKTVESHRTTLMRNLSIHSVAGLVRYAIRNGMIAPDDNGDPGDPSLSAQESINA